MQTLPTASTDPHSTVAYPHRGNRSRSLPPAILATDAINGKPSSRKEPGAPFRATLAVNATERETRDQQERKIDLRSIIIFGRKAKEGKMVRASVVEEAAEINAAADTECQVPTLPTVLF